MKWYFTFMQRQKILKDKFVVIEGDAETALKIMVENFGHLWAFQYSEREWQDKDQVQMFNLKEIKW